MPFPKASDIEGAILQELKPLGEVRPQDLYWRLSPYFPCLSDAELRLKTSWGRNKWKLLVQRASKTLVEKGELEKSAGRWKLTDKGRLRAEREEVPVQLVLSFQTPEPLPSHGEIKKKLMEIGRILGKYVQEEYQRYDVIWKDSEVAPRISHVFEVQNRGKVESALTKLKHAYDTQRSRPFLVIADERDLRKARELLLPFFSGSFHEIGQVTTVLTFREVDEVYRSLVPIKALLQPFFAE